MEGSEIDRRFALAVAKLQREIAHRGMRSSTAGPTRGFYLKKIEPERLCRSLEGALARCHDLPQVCITLKDRYHFDKQVFGTFAGDEDYSEFDYIGIAGNDIIVAAHIWDDTGVAIVLRGISLNAILEIGVYYEEDLEKKEAA